MLELDCAFALPRPLGPFLSSQGVTRQHSSCSHVNWQLLGADPHGENLQEKQTNKPKLIKKLALGGKAMIGAQVTLFCK